MSCCSFNVCSLITDVRESVSEMPRDPADVKTLLMEHLGIGGDAKAATTAIAKPALNCSTVSTVFKHPISYSDPDKLHELPMTIIEDLEMIQPKPTSTKVDKTVSFSHCVTISSIQVTNLFCSISIVFL